MHAESRVKRLTAFCEDKEHAQHVIDSLIGLGVAYEDVSLLVVSRNTTDQATVEHTTGVPRAAAVGSALGGAIGVGLAAVGWLPGVLAAGPVLTMLQGLAGGAAAGSLVSALAGLGWWKAEVDVPKELVGAEGILVGVPISAERAEEVARVARSAGALRVHVA